MNSLIYDQIVFVDYNLEVEHTLNDDYKMLKKHQMRHFFFKLSLMYLCLEENEHDINGKRNTKEPFDPKVITIELGYGNSTLL